ncbi:MAG: hypothetical protein VZS44_04375 [Bacilli bacterium]|nr:hypothetical protein [Bacilli bacterium]
MNENNNNNPELLTPNIPTQDNNQGLLTPNIPIQDNNLNTTTNNGQENIIPELKPQTSNSELLTPTTPIQNDNSNITNNQQNITPTAPTQDNTTNKTQQPTPKEPEISNNEPNNQPVTINPKPEKNKKILLGAGIVAFIIIAFILGKGLFSSSGGTKDGTTVNEGEVLSIKNEISEYDIKVNSVEKNISKKGILNEEKIFTKLNITITNKKESELYIGGIGFNTFSLNDDLGNEIGSCSALAIIDYDITDSIVNTVGAKQTATGNLYCGMNSKENPSKFVITSVTGFDKEAYQKDNVIKSTDINKFYIKIK